MKKEYIFVLLLRRRDWLGPHDTVAIYILSKDSDLSVYRSIYVEISGCEAVACHYAV